MSITATDLWRAQMGFELLADADQASTREVLRKFVVGEQVAAADLPADIAAWSKPLLNAGRFGVNICARVVNEASSRLNIIGFECDDAEVAAEVEGWWHACQGDKLLNALLLACMTDGVAFVVLGYDADGQPTAHVNTSISSTAEGYNTGIEVHEIDDTGRIVAATKHFTKTRYLDATNGVWARVIDYVLAMVGRDRQRSMVRQVTQRWQVIYADGQIRRFVADQGGVWRDPTPEDGYAAAEAWPYGSPVIAFASPVGGELGPVLPLQRLLNRAVLSAAHAGEVSGFQRIITIDVNDLADGQLVGPGAYIQHKSLEERSGSVQVLEADDLQPTLEQVKLWAELACLVSGTPVHTLPWNHSSQPPSGEALKTMMEPLLAKVRLYQEHLGPQFELMFERWQRMAGREPVRVTPKWEDASFESDVEAATVAAQLQTLNADPETILRRAGVDGAELQRSLEWAAAAEQRSAEMLAQFAGRTQAETSLADDELQDTEVSDAA